VAGRELLVQATPRYSSARRGQGSVILDEFVAVTGYERKYAVVIDGTADHRWSLSAGASRPRLAARPAAC
jgi:hypothetical protein